MANFDAMQQEELAVLKIPIFFTQVILLTYQKRGYGIYRLGNYRIHINVRLTQVRGEEATNKNILLSLLILPFNRAKILF